MRICQSQTQSKMKSLARFNYFYTRLEFMRKLKKRTKRKKNCAHAQCQLFIFIRKKNEIESMPKEKNVVSYCLVFIGKLIIRKQ